MPGLDLMVLDYSGTLSLASALFGQPTRLAKALRLSGLKEAGVDSLSFFWNEIVNPTWDEGSLTTVGYAEVIRRRLLACRPRPSIPDHARHVAEAASRFVRSYLAAATVHSAWIPVLRKLGGRPGLRVIVATDHYAEATQAILDHLRVAGVAAGLPGTGDSSGTTFFVANSADLGSHKADGVFWRRLRDRLAWPVVSRVLYVDDFGANEALGDAYRDPQKVAERAGKTASLLQVIWEADVHVVPFLLENILARWEGEEVKKRFLRLVADTERIIFNDLQ